MEEYCDRLSREEKEKKRNLAVGIRMSTGLMAGYEYCPEVDNLVIRSVKYVCLETPGRPQIEGPHPDGTIRTGILQLLIAPEANVKMHKLHDGSYILQKKDEEEEEDGDGE